MPLTYSVMANVPLQLYTTSGTTDTTGNLNISLPAGLFTVVYAAMATVVRDSAAPATAAFAQVRSYSASNVIVQVFESATIPAKIVGSSEALAVTTTATTVLVTVFGT